MQKLYLPPSDLDPEIDFSHDENKFRISGVSRPENVRATYEAAISWLSDYKAELAAGNSPYSKENPLTLQLDLEYFNSSSAIFLYDLVMIIKAIREERIPARITWIYDPADTDSLEAGEDLSILAEMEFDYIKRQA
ncbi:MAG: DUF1987 domain-containing protein [Bacteroidales bacterium]|nr:DUF1987 domain-containing protein [Bacteroidales bacterium]